MSNNEVKYRYGDDDDNNNNRQLKENLVTNYCN